MNFLTHIFYRYNVQPIIDPHVVQYVVGIMNEKNAQLGKPAFGTIFIFKLPELFINIPNAMAVKDNTARQFLYLTSTTLDILEHLVCDPEAQTYTLTCIAPRSPYTMKVVLTKKPAERMMRALIEHELGHLYHPHHCRKYAPVVLVKASIGLITAWIGVYYYFVSHASPFFIHGITIDWPLFLMGFGMYYALAYFIQLTNSSFTSSKNWEQEADEFIANDPKILHGMILFQEIMLQAQTYIYSYSNWWIKFHAWWKWMDCAEFVRQNRVAAHKYFERSSPLGEAYHPMPEERIGRFKERIGQLTAENMPEIEPISIIIYHGTRIVQKYTA